MRHSAVIGLAAVGSFCVTAASGALTDFVDPLIGTAGTGHTTPAACCPFGLVQAGPDTGNVGWDYCSGYRNSDDRIVGFSQTHLNGTGWMDLGDAMIMPVKGDADRDGFPGSRFRKESEKASCGYYHVFLDDAGADVEVTASEHVALYSIRYEAPKEAKLLVDAQYGIVYKEQNLLEHVVDSAVERISEDSIGGTVHVKHWVERMYSFKVMFSRPFSDIRVLPKRSEKERAPRYLVSFNLKDGEALLVKVVLSAEGGMSGVEANLRAEIPGWDFAEVRSRALRKWEEILTRVSMEGDDRQRTNFYTALYHLCVQPNNIADAGARPFYSTFSTWDTFRAAHPLYTVILPELVPDMVDSMLEQGRRTGYLPIWSLWGRENQNMIGTHSVPVIVDWFLKKQDQLPSSRAYWEAAYAQIKDSLTEAHTGRVKERWDLVDEYGYYPCDVIKGEGVSRLLECAYDDWCAAQMAEALGKSSDARFFAERSACWTNVFDRTMGLVRGRKKDATWRTPYDPFLFGHGDESDNDFTEGNAYQYTWHVMQNPTGLIEAMGGRRAATVALDRLFSMSNVRRGSDGTDDISGMIGQYVHGNEPSHHIPYFYQFLGRGDRVAETVREVFDRFYEPRPDGLCGNDDCGQMSAWYLFSAMGFYPFNPCGGEYVIGAPQVPKATLHLGNWKTFKVLAKNLTTENKYVESVYLNGKKTDGRSIRHSDIENGGELVFNMAPKCATRYNGVTAHRGDSANHPQNSLRAFIAANALGADWIETDVHETKDGELVISHNDSTGDYCSTNAIIALSRYDDLATLDMAEKFRRDRGLTMAQCPRVKILKLEEALDYVLSARKARISIQPKSDSVDKIMALVRRMNALDWVGFNDSSLQKMRRVKELEPGVPVFWDRVDPDVLKDIPIAKQHGFESVVLYWTHATEEIVRKLHAIGVEVGVWTVNEREDIVKCLDMGVDRIYTDDPGRLLDIHAKGKEANR